MQVLVLVVRPSRRCAVYDSVVASCVVADGAEKNGQKCCFRRTMDPAGACCCRGGDSSLLSAPESEGLPKH